MTDSLAVRYAIDGALDRLAYCLQGNATRLGDIEQIRRQVADLVAALEAGAEGVVAVTEEMIDCALRLLPTLPRVCMQVALEDALAAAPKASEAVEFWCDYCGKAYTDARYCCDARREYLNAHGHYETPQADPAPPVADMPRDSWVLRSEHARIVAEKDAEIASLDASNVRIVLDFDREHKRAEAMAGLLRDVRPYIGTTFRGRIDALLRDGLAGQEGAG